MTYERRSWHGDLIVCILWSGNKFDPEEDQELGMHQIVKLSDIGCHILFGYPIKYLEQGFQKKQGKNSDNR